MLPTSTPVAPATVPPADAFLTPPALLQEHVTPPRGSAPEPVQPTLVDHTLVQTPAHEAASILNARPDIGMAQSGAVLALTGIVITPLVALLVRRIFPGRNVVFARWGFSHVVLIVAAILAALALTSVVGPTGEEHVVLNLARMAIAEGAGVLLLAWYAIRLDPEGIRCLGLWRGKHVRALGAGLSAYVLLAPAIAGVGLLSSWLVDVTHLGTGKQQVAQQLANIAPGERWIPVLLGTLVVPLFEELLFRVFLQPLFVQNFRERAGIALTSILFAALHGVDAFLPIFVLSLLLGSIMLRTQRLLAVWGIHALHNGLQFWMMYAVVDHANRPHPSLWYLF
jgi:membrane protease YdiL (CAAX protease family)